jgi:hypothetical protein
MVLRYLPSQDGFGFFHQTLIEKSIAIMIATENPLSINQTLIEKSQADLD